MADIVNYVLLAIVVSALAVLVFRIFRYKGWSAALMGAEIAETAGHAMAASSLGFAVEARVHRLSSPAPYRSVGLELVERVAGSYRVLPVTMSVTEARNLAELLLQAADTPPNDSFKPTPLRGAA